MRGTVSAVRRCVQVVDGGPCTSGALRGELKFRDSQGRVLLGPEELAEKEVRRRRAEARRRKRAEQRAEEEACQREEAERRALEEARQREEAERRALEAERRMAELQARLEQLKPQG